jgi:hypothetical protein
VVFLADLDQEPHSRWPGLLLGAAIALPVALAVGAYVLPRLREAIVQAALDHDTHARDRDAYMNQLCTTALVVERDEAVCGCILGAEFPSMDCMDGFFVWLTDRQINRCEESATFDEAVGFCSCVQAVGDASEKAGEGTAADRVKVQGYPRCLTLEDALGFPDLEQLAPTFVDAPERSG